MCILSFKSPLVFSNLDVDFFFSNFSNVGLDTREEAMRIISRGNVTHVYTSLYCLSLQTSVLSLE